MSQDEETLAKTDDTERLLELAAEDFRDHWWLVQPKNDITMETILMVWDRLIQPLSRLSLLLAALASRGGSARYEAAHLACSS
jgi:hypothetical protein